MRLPDPNAIVVGDEDTAAAKIAVSKEECGSEVARPPVHDAVDGEPEADQQHEEAEHEPALERHDLERSLDPRRRGEETLIHGEGPREDREDHRLGADEHHHHREDERVHVEREAADRDGPGQERGTEHGPGAQQHDPGVQEQPAGAVEHEEAQVGVRTSRFTHTPCRRDSYGDAPPARV